MSVDLEFYLSPWDEWGLNADHGNVYAGAEEPLAALEIEMEAPGMDEYTARQYLRDIPYCGWSVVNEGSLRANGLELISNRPQAVPVLNAQLMQLSAILSESHPTFRAAIHTHVNVQNLNRFEYMRLCVMYALQERTFYDWVGNGRDESVFCIPWEHGSAHIEELMEAYAMGCPDAWRGALFSAPKYSGMNLQATVKFGSVEFRHMPTPEFETTLGVRRVSEFVDKCTHLVSRAKLSPVHYQSPETLHYGLQGMIMGFSSASYPPPMESSVADVLAMGSVHDPELLFEDVSAHVYVHGVKLRRQLAGIFNEPDFDLDEPPQSGLGVITDEHLRAVQAELAARSSEVFSWGTPYEDGTTSTWRVAYHEPNENEEETE